MLLVLLGGSSCGRLCRGPLLGVEGGPGRALGRGPRTASQGPSFHVPLRDSVHAQRSGRDVLAHGGAGAGRGAVTDRDRGDEHVVRAHAHVAADGGAVLVHPVVVRHDRAGADVGALADLGVADVAEVGHLRALADHRVLRLDEAADLALRAEVRAGAQVGEGADGRALADHGEQRVGADHLGAGADLGVAQGGVRADHGLGADVAGAVQLDAGADDRVLADGDIRIDPGGGRVDDRHPVPHVPLQGATVQLGAELGELEPVVDPLDHHHVGGDQGADRAAVGAGDPEHIGEVHLALGVVGADAGEGVAQHRDVEGVDAGVDLVDLALLRGGVLVLDDAEHLAAVLAAQDAAVAGGVGHPGGEHGHGGAGALVLGDQLTQGRGIQQRHVPVGDQHGALGGGDPLEPALDGASGAWDVVLIGDGDLGIVLGEVGGDAVALVPQHHHQLAGAGALGGVDGVHQERAAPDLVHDLGGAGLHSRPGPGGQDDDSGGGGFHVGSSSDR